MQISQKKKSSRLSLPQNRVRTKGLKTVTDLDVYDFEKVIGEGKFSDVVKATNKETGEVCAVKVIDKKKIDDERTLRKLETEVKIQSSCQHPNILQLTGVYDDEDTRCLFMEMAYGGDLFDKIIEKVVFTEEEARVVVKQILRACVYLHARNIAHRDLKPENILYMSKDEDSILKICDFGFAKQATSAEEILGTPCFPENHEILTNRGFMDLDAWLSHRGDPELLVASYNVDTKEIVFEKPLRELVFPREKRQLVEFSSSSNGGLSYLVTQDHQVFVQHGEVGASGFEPALNRPLAVRAESSGGIARKMVHLSSPGTPAKVTAERFVSELSAARHVALAENGWRRQDGAEQQWSSEELELYGANLAGHVASWVWSCSSEQLQCIVDGLKIKAGKAGGLLAQTASFRDDLIRLLTLAGYSAVFEKMVGGGFLVSFTSCLDDSCLVADRLAGGIRLQEVESRVWCLTMPRGLLWVRQSEKSDDGEVVRASRLVLTGNCGTINYAAPEIVDCEYNISVDLWAIGCITYFLLFGIPPFYSEKDDDDEVMDQLMMAKDDISVIKFPEDAPCSKEARAFILALLNPNPAKRPSATDALQLDWMKKSMDMDGEDADVDEVWEEFRKLRLAEMPEDPEERRARLNKILSFVSHRGDEDEDNAPIKSPKMPAEPTGESAARKTAANRNTRRDSVKKQNSMWN